MSYVTWAMHNMVIQIMYLYSTCKQIYSKVEEVKIVSCIYL